MFANITSPHTRQGNTVTRIMLQLIYALVPGLMALLWFFGWGVIINICIAAVTALLAEAAILKVRKRPVLPALLDGSALVTAILLAMAIPPSSPWWLTVIGILFAIGIAKHLYGGLGYNPFNPAMVAYVMLLISYPREMSAWLTPSPVAEQSPGLVTMLGLIFGGNDHYDALTMATPMDTLKTQVRLDHNVLDIMSSNSVFGAIAGIGWEWISICFLLGGLWLIYKKVISWHIPVAMITTIFVMAAIFSWVDGDAYAPPLFHLLSGATMLGAFFIATDPVTSATTKTGKIIFGVGIGVLTYVIRTWGGYPDGVAFAVLLMNMMVPLIDHYTQPRVFGHK